MDPGALEGNPAAQLRSLLAAFAAQGDNLNAAEAWEVALGVSEGDLLLTAVARVCRLGREVRTLAETMPEHARADVQLANFHQIETVLGRSVNLAGFAKAAYLGGLDTAGWHSLDLADVMFSRELSVETVDKDTVSALREHVAALISEVLEADDLDARSIEEIVGHLRAVEECLTATQLHNVRDLRRRSDGLTGAFVRLWARFGERVTLTKIALVLGLLATTLDAAVHLKELTAGNSSVPIVIQQVTGTNPRQMTGPADASSPPQITGPADEASPHEPVEP